MIQNNIIDIIYVIEVLTCVKLIFSRIFDTLHDKLLMKLDDLDESFLTF